MPNVGTLLLGRAHLAQNVPGVPAHVGIDRQVARGNGDFHGYQSDVA
jgi:hypothetical protein